MIKCFQIIGSTKFSFIHIVYFVVLLAIWNVQAASAKSLIYDQGGDLVEYDRQNAQFSTDPEQNESDLKIKGLLENYLISKRKQTISNDDDWVEPEDAGAKSMNEIRLSSRSTSTRDHHSLIKKLTRTPLAGKRAWDIQTYYDIMLQTDGSILLIPKDVNKNHYFIG